jgi:fructose-bisphosphate aldolase, class II
MPQVAAAALIEAAEAAHTAVAAFNVITLEHGEAIVVGAEAAGKPVMLALSENAVRYHDNAVAPIAAAMVELARAARVDVALHLDHVENVELARRAPDIGFGSVMVDAGRLPYRDNVEQTLTATRWLHARGVYVEAELGYVGGKDTQVQSAHAPGVRTDPGQAADFVAQTSIDALAVAVGSSHAMTTRTATLDIGLIEKLHAAVSVPLVLHGSSGVPDHELHAAVAAGIRKVNVGTALNIAYTDAVRTWLGANDGIDPRKYLRPARTEMSHTVHALIDVISC